MRKLLNQPWFAGLLALAALAAVGRSVLGGNLGWFSFGTAKAAPLPHVDEDTVAETVRLPPAAALQALVMPVDIRNPFAARFRPEAAANHAPEPDEVDRVHLSAIWTQGGATWLLVNDRVCQAGEDLGRIRLESTTPDGVWVTHWRGRDFVTLGGDFVLTTPAGAGVPSATNSL